MLASLKLTSSFLGLVSSTFMYPTGCFSLLLRPPVPSSFLDGVWIKVEAGFQGACTPVLPPHCGSPLDSCRATGLSCIWMSWPTAGPISTFWRLRWRLLLKAGVQARISSGQLFCTLKSHEDLQPLWSHNALSSSVSCLGICRLLALSSHCAGMYRIV